VRVRTTKIDPVVVAELTRKHGTTDPYVAVACEALGIRPEQVTPELRSLVKQRLHYWAWSGEPGLLPMGLVRGATPHGLLN